MLDAVPGADGMYTVQAPEGVTSLESTTTLAFRSASVETNYLRVHVPTLVKRATVPLVRGSDGCYTPSPTPSYAPSLSTYINPSPDPSLAAKTEDVASPFQCGAVVNSLGRGSSQVSITDYKWVAPDVYNASLRDKWGDAPYLIFERGSAPIPVATIRVRP